MNSMDRQTASNSRRWLGVRKHPARSLIRSQATNRGAYHSIWNWIGCRRDGRQEPPGDALRIQERAGSCWNALISLGGRVAETLPVITHFRPGLPGLGWGAGF